MVPEWLNLLSCGITVGTAGPTIHNYISSFRRAKKIEILNETSVTKLEQLNGKLATLEGHLTKLADQVYASDHSGIKVQGYSNHSFQTNIEDFESICRGAELIIDKPIFSNGDLLHKFENSPELFLIGIQPLLKEGADLKLLQDTTMVPWHFRKWGVDLVGFAKRGFIESLGVDYRPLPIEPIRKKVVGESRPREPKKLESLNRSGKQNVATAKTVSPQFSSSRHLTYPKHKPSKVAKKGLNLWMPESDEPKSKITLFGVGGAGGNAINAMIKKQLKGVEFVVANTDATALQQSRSPSRIQLGVKVTEGLGSGARPSVGAAAAEESIEQIVDYLAGAHMCIITAGMGGGTGTGAAPIIAQAARELGVLTVGFVTTPFPFEGGKRMRQAEYGVEALRKMVDKLIVFPNEGFYKLANEKTTFSEAFDLLDDALFQCVKVWSEIMSRPDAINLDFAELRPILDEVAKGVMRRYFVTGKDSAI